MSRRNATRSAGKRQTPYGAQQRQGSGIFGLPGQSFSHVDEGKTPQRLNYMSTPNRQMDNRNPSTKLNSLNDMTSDQRCSNTKNSNSDFVQNSEINRVVVKEDIIPVEVHSVAAASLPSHQPIKQQPYTLSKFSQKQLVHIRTSKNAALFREVMRSRVSYIIVLRKLWEAGDIVGVYYCIKNAKNSDGLAAAVLSMIKQTTLESGPGQVSPMMMCIFLVPLARQILNSKYEDFVVSSLNAVMCVLRELSKPLMKACNAPGDITTQKGQLLLYNDCMTELDQLLNDVKKVLDKVIGLRNTTGKTNAIEHRANRVISKLNIILGCK